MKWIQENKLVCLLVLIKFLLPFLITDPTWELHRDEYLYYEQGQHLSLGYLENPPMIGLLAWISSLLGGSAFAIKIWPALTGAITLLLTVALAENFGGRTFAKCVAGLGILFSAFMRIHYLFQPNMLDILSWLAAAYALVRHINTGRNRYLYLLALCLALGWWSKYSVLFFIAATGISLLLTYHRRTLTNKHFWLAMLVGLVIITPNLTWQYQHNWPLVHHMEELRETQLQYISKTGFLKEQLLLLLPVFFVWVGGLIWVLRQKKYRIIGYIYITVILLLLFGSGKGYYALGAYPMLLAAGGKWLEDLTMKRRWLRYISIVIILAASLPFIPLLLPIQSPAVMAKFNTDNGIKAMGLLKWEDQHDHALQQDFADMLGWKELAERSERYFLSLPDTVRARTIVYCRNYGQAGSLKYYSKDDRFKQKIISDNGSFLLWIPPRPGFEHLLFIGRSIPGSDDEVFNHFESREVIDSVRNHLSRSFGTKIIVYRNADDQASRLATDGLNEMKQEFIR